jgi:hypothetical protein
MSQIKDLGISNYPLFEHANNISISYNDATYTAVVPNAYQLSQIYTNREILDTFDPSGENNLTTWTFGTKSRAFCCAIGNEYSGYSGYVSFAWRSNGFLDVAGTLDGINYTGGYLPIIEIPV